MAKTEELKNQIAGQIKQTPAATTPMTTAQIIKTRLESEGYVKRYTEIMGKKANYFISAIVAMAGNELKDVEPNSIMVCAHTAASLNLMLNKQLGQAWVVPYFNRDKGYKVAQFQVGYKGWIQLALRSGFYEQIAAITVYSGQFDGFNRLTEELKYNELAKKSEEVVGYAFRFKLLNGFKKTAYWPKDQALKHALKYNPECRKAKSLTGIWRDDFDAMALKTLVSYNLRTWGLLSVEMEEAIFSENNDGSESPIENAQFVDLSDQETPEQPSSEPPAQETPAATQPEPNELVFGPNNKVF